MTLPAEKWVSNSLKTTCQQLDLWIKICNVCHFFKGKFGIEEGHHKQSHNPEYHNLTPFPTDMADDNRLL
jgi:hypothetical protein